MNIETCFYSFCYSYSKCRSLPRHTARSRALGSSGLDRGSSEDDNRPQETHNCQITIRIWYPKWQWQQSNAFCSLARCTPSITCNTTGAWSAPHSSSLRCFARDVRWEISSQCICNSVRCWWYAVGASPSPQPRAHVLFGVIRLVFESCQVRGEKEG